MQSQGYPECEMLFLTSQQKHADAHTHICMSGHVTRTPQQSPSASINAAGKWSVLAMPQVPPRMKGSWLNGVLKAGIAGTIPNVVFLARKERLRTHAN